MIVKLRTEHHLEFLSLTGGCRGSSEYTHVKMLHCWKSHALAHISYSVTCSRCDMFALCKIQNVLTYSSRVTSAYFIHEFVVPRTRFKEPMVPSDFQINCGKANKRYPVTI